MPNRTRLPLIAVTTISVFNAGKTIRSPILRVNTSMAFPPCTKAQASRTLVVQLACRGKLVILLPHPLRAQNGRPLRPACLRTLFFGVVRGPGMSANAEKDAMNYCSWRTITVHRIRSEWKGSTVFRKRLRPMSSWRKNCPTHEYTSPQSHSPECGQSNIPKPLRFWAVMVHGECRKMP